MNNTPNFNHGIESEKIRVLLVSWYLQVSPNSMMAGIFKSFILCSMRNSLLNGGNHSGPISPPTIVAKSDFASGILFFEDEFSYS